MTSTDILARGWWCLRVQRVSSSFSSRASRLAFWRKGDNIEDVWNVMRAASISGKTEAVLYRKIIDQV